MKTATALMLLLFITAGLLYAQGSPPPLPAGVKPGFITIPSGEFSLMMTGEKGRYFSVDSKNRRVELPPGEYTLYVVSLRKKDKSGREWSISSKYLSRPMKVFEGKVTTLRFGEPLKASVRKVGKELNFEITGSSGEGYTYFAVKKTRLEPPSFTITDPSGKVIESGQFKYG
jgi:hypothetical protein